MPPSLHEAVVRKAEDEGVSLNQLMTSAVARFVGYDVPVQNKSCGQFGRVKINITSPIDDKTLEKLTIGTRVLISGVVYTARDAAT